MTSYLRSQQILKNARIKIGDDIVNSENEIMRDLAKYNNLTIVDSAKHFPQDEQFFVDSVHFTPKGMTKLAQDIASTLEPLLYKQKISNS